MESYPATLAIDYFEGPRDRLTTFFRPFVAIPIGIVALLLPGMGGEGSSGGITFLPNVLMLLFRKKYPRWWFDWNLQVTRFLTRIGAYTGLLFDEYPSTDEEQAVHLELVYPDAESELSRGLPLIKWFLAIPHYFVLAFIGIAVFVCIIAAWFAILFTGKMPRALFDFIVGYMRWNLRVMAYAFLLTTDRYPPFSLD